MRRRSRSARDATKHAFVTPSIQILEEATKMGRLHLVRVSPRFNNRVLDELRGRPERKDRPTCLKVAFVYWGKLILS